MPELAPFYLKNIIFQTIEPEFSDSCLLLEMIRFSKNLALHPSRDWTTPSSPALHPVLESMLPQPSSARSTSAHPRFKRPLQGLVSPKRQRESKTRFGGFHYRMPPAPKPSSKSREFPEGSALQKPPSSPGPKPGPGKHGTTSDSRAGAGMVVRFDRAISRSGSARSAGSGSPAPASRWRIPP